MARPQRRGFSPRRGHRRQSLLERWWSGATGAFLDDNVACSFLVAPDTITDEEFESHLRTEAATI